MQPPHTPSPGAIAQRLGSIAQGVGFRVAHETVIPSRPGRLEAPPVELERPLRAVIESEYPKGLFHHQVVALRFALAGTDVCLATSTASGKSLVFMAAAVHRLLTEPSATVVALYPAKALIQDQLSKWTRFLSAFSLAPGYIDGAVSMDARERVLAEHRVVLMTPDVAHAWMMSHAGDAGVRRFMSRLRLLILDEAHVYDGVFGTNMAYFIRRLLAATKVDRMIASTATIGDPEGYMLRLTGRAFSLVGESMEGSPRPQKNILLLRPSGSRSFDQTALLLHELTVSGTGRFLAFADSRRVVEQLVAVLERRGLGGEEPEEESVPEDAHEPVGRQVLPYRSGYEEQDRQDIQRALANGDLAGVVSTSALELGLDIGEIDVVVLLDSPPTVKSFWQRVGRAGRKNAAACLVIDSKGTIASTPDGLQGYMQRPVEPGWLYLDNRYLQYTQALCAAQEVGTIGEGQYDRSGFASLPASFSKMLDNELNPVDAVPEDLYHLKQRGQAGPHYEYPIRTGIEKGFQVVEHLGGNHRHLGTLTFSQVLREGFPGAIYYYMARPYRVTQVNYRAGQVVVKTSRRWTTRPSLQNMVFPRFQAILSGRRSPRGFVVEAPLQVSERVIGFVEQRGPNKTVHTYGPGSPYSQRPLQRFLDTTGVCWHFDSPSVLTQMVADSLLDAFAACCGVEKRDVGVGLFRAKPSQLWSGECQGFVSTTQLTAVYG